MHLLTRLWQSGVSLLTWRFENVLDQVSPFDRFSSPFPVFPLLALVLWLQGGLTLLWFTPSTVQANTQSTWRRSPYLYWLTGVIGLAGALGLAGANRISQLLPDASGGLPTSNYDEMVYFQGASLLTQGHWPYRDFFLAHPPGAELIYAALLKLSGVTGLAGFEMARWGAIGLGLGTVAGAFWVAGRMWPGPVGRFGLWPGLGAAWLYAADARAAGIATLETPSNALAAAAVGCYLEADRVKGRLAGGGLLVASGGLTAGAIGCKLPALALLVALVGFSLLRQQWAKLGWLLGGLLAGASLLIGPFLLVAGPGELLRQVVFFQLLRPPETREGKDQLGRLADGPENSLTIWLAGVALLLLAGWLLTARPKLGYWLLPVLWSLPLVAVFTLSKSFHPWYYVQWALPLSLLAAGWLSRNIWYDLNLELGRLRVAGRWLTGVWGFVILLVAGPLFVAQWQAAHQLQLDPVYQPAAATLNTILPASSALLVFDPGYSLLADRAPGRLPATGKYLVDSAGYMAYLNLNIDRRGLFDLFKSQFNGGGGERGQEQALFRQGRAQAMVIEAMSGVSGAVVDLKLALWQLTPQSVEFIQTGSSKIKTVGYADLYQVYSRESRQPRQFSNGLWLTSFGLSTSRAGQANFDQPNRDGSLRLSSQETGSRNLDLRFIWRVTRPPAQAVKLFIHLVDEKGNIVIQRDIAPLEGQADTRQWQSGDAYQDVHGLPLPANLPPGHYQVEIGCYDQATGQRIALIEGDDHLRIGYLVVE